jgi:glycosyltransferase involved in cell wall biosynthesis
MITDGDDGLLAPPKDPAAWAAAITRLLGDPGLPARLSENARASAARFSLERFSPAIRAAHLAAL